MGLTINTNIDALDAYRNLSITQSKLSDSLQKLSSGYRINKAADDAAGLSISQGLQAQIGGLTQAVKNAQDGINVVQTADGALTEVDSILQRMNSLAVQAANTGSQDTSARQAAQTELVQLNKDLDNIGSTTQFGNSKLLDGSFGSSAASESFSVSGGKVVASTASFKLAGTFNGTALAATAVNVADGTYTSASAFQSALQNGIDATLTTNSIAAGSVKATVTDAGGGVWKVSLTSDAVGSGNAFTTSATAGLTDGNTNTVKVDGTSSNQGAAGGVFQIGANAGQSEAVTIGAISSTALSTGSLDLVGNPSAAITVIQNAISQVSTERANLGAYQNGFQHTINNLNVTVENLQASNSSIQDTDMASEMVNFTKEQVLQQAGVAMLAQANSVSQSVLKLLG
jgi:flagellin